MSRKIARFVKGLILLYSLSPRLSAMTLDRPEEGDTVRQVREKFAVASQVRAPELVLGIWSCVAYSVDGRTLPYRLHYMDIVKIINNLFVDKAKMGKYGPIAYRFDRYGFYGGEYGGIADARLTSDQSELIFERAYFDESQKEDDFDSIANPGWKAWVYNVCKKS